MRSVTAASELSVTRSGDSLAPSGATNNDDDTSTAASAHPSAVAHWPKSGRAGATYTVPFPANADNISAQIHDNMQHVKPKQRRNKPTLSCLECVERKTKCDRARPCLACIKRQSACEYTAIANLIASAGRRTGVPNNRTRVVHKATGKISKASSNAAVSLPPETAERQLPKDHATSLAKDGSSRHQKHQTLPEGSPHPLPILPSSPNSPSNVFSVGLQHPFANYWTCQGGLPEVVSVLPAKDQADLLIAKYFEAVDPVFPFMHRRTFYSDYELFWALPQEEKGKTDASLVALHFALYALGTQFTPFPSYAERSQTAEFYCSAANQALRVYSYLNRTSLRAIQAMLLVAYFLMNDNHATDAYAWAGIHLRQTYAMRLNRDPDLVVPDAPILEKQQRRRLWLAVFLHDTFISVLLKMPPTATHSDVPVDSLADDDGFGDDDADVCLNTPLRVDNLMSINVIAPQMCETLPPPQQHHLISWETVRDDTAYMKSTWHVANFVQENFASPSSLSLPIANSPRHKETLVGAFKRLYRSFPSHITTLDYNFLKDLAAIRPRAARQNLFLNSHYQHILMLLQASENTKAGVMANIVGTLEAAHDTVWTFFKLWDLFEAEARVWLSSQHRAFEASLLMANLLILPSQTNNQHDSARARAKDDIARMLELMDQYGDHMEMHTARKTTLLEAFERTLTADDRTFRYAHILGLR